MCKWAATSLSILLVIALFCFICVGIANAGSYTYTLSGGPSSDTPLMVDDDLAVKVNAKTVFVDDDRVSTHDGRAKWNGTPIPFSASPGDVIQIIATNPGGVDIELSPLYLHVNGQSLKLSDGVPNTRREEHGEFFNESFMISIPPPLVSIVDFSPSPVHGGEDLAVKVSWANIPTGWKLVVSLEESDLNCTRLADDVSKNVLGSGEETFKLKAYPTTETHGEAKVCACFSINEKGEWTGVFEKKNIMVYPKTMIIPPLIFGIIALIILIAGIFVVRRKMTSNTKQKPSRSRKLNRKTLSELSKLMAYILRHDKKQKFRVDLDEKCYADINQLVKAISSRGKWRWVNRKHIEEVAGQSFYRGKRRFVIKGDKIKATYRVTRNCPSTSRPPPKPTPSPSLEQKVKEKLNRKTLSELSKLMAYILRHDKKQKFWVDLDENCYAKIDQLVKAISSIGKWRWINRKHIEEVAAQSFYRGKRRFVIKDDKIKATYRITRKCPSTPTPPPKPTPSPSLEQKVKEKQISSSMPRLMSMPRLITIERAIYDPCKRDFIDRALPRMKEWINRYDPGAYWFAISVQNDTDRAIEEWDVELEFSSALKIKEAKIEGLEIEIPHEAHLGAFKISVPKEYGIVIPKGGAQRVYFKLRADKPKTTYKISGVFRSAIGEVPIRAKEFKYLCDTGVSLGAVKAELKKTFSEIDAARLVLSFKTVQEIDRMCDQEAKTEEYLDKLSTLKNYTEGFSAMFTKHLDEFSRFMKQEQLEYLDDEYKGKVRRFCTKLVDVWINEFLR